MARAPFVAIRFDMAAEGAPGRDAIVARVAAEIAAGRLPAGSRMPPVRVLAHQLGISKNTVSAAYDELAARGLIVSSERDGVFVAAPPAPAAAGSQAARRPPARAALRGATVSQRPAQEPGVIHLSSVFIDPDLLPRDRLADCVRSVLGSPGLKPYYDDQGYPPLREAIAARLTARGMDVRTDDVVLTSGSQQALDMICRALVTRRIATESPAYAIGKQLFESYDLEYTGLPIDPFGGLDLDAWERALRAARPSVFYGITSFQNPTGYSYATHELMRLLDWSAELGFGLVEDDWGSDMLSHSEYRPTLRALGGRSVLYANSFTKKLLPALRIGFLAGDEESVPALVAAKRVATLGNPALIEAALFEFLDRGYYDTHLASMQEALDRKYALCLERLRAKMPEGVRWTMPGGGPVLWLELPPEVSVEALRSRCLKEGVLIDSSAPAFTGPPHLNGFRLGYAQPKAEALERGIEILGREIDREREAVSAVRTAGGHR